MTVTGTFLPITRHFREHVFLLAALRCASEHQVTLLQADCLLKQVKCLTLALAFGDLTS